MLYTNFIKYIEYIKRDTDKLQRVTLVTQVIEKCFFLVPQEPLCQYLTNISTNHTLVKETAVLLRKLDPVIKSLKLFAMYGLVTYVNALVLLLLLCTCVLHNNYFL